MPAIKCLKTGLIYRNLKPHVRSIHAFFPSVVVMANGEMLATIVLGEAFEAVNLHTNICRSLDNGETWQLEGPIYPGTKGRLTSDSARLTALPDGGLAAFIMRCERAEHPEEGLTSHATLGFVPTELMIARSKDFGHTWSNPRAFAPPLVGPSFEICCPITPLKDGRWVLPTQTWPGWNGDCPNGIKMIAFISGDSGQTWPKYMEVMKEPAGRVFFWESKIVELSDGRLLAVAWAYDDAAKCDRPNQYALSHDGGRSWTSPRSTGLKGQTLTPFVLDEDRILCVYRRMDKAGLWANVSRLEQDRWINEAEEPLWGTAASGLTATAENMVHNFNVLRFGAPCVACLAGGVLFVAFWCYEDCVSVIRWFKLRVS